MTTEWDGAVVRHLERVGGIYARAGATRFLQNAIAEIWRNNRARWSPIGHFDDTNTLGYQTHRNVNNRISATFAESNVSSQVVTEIEAGIPFLVADTFRLRVVKAPIESGMRPNLREDFDWSTSATRQIAAQRNSLHYYPLQVADWTLEYEDDPRPSHKRQIELCRDLFLVWAADLDSDATSAWLGLPSLGDVPWLGLIDLWTAYTRSQDNYFEEDVEDDLDPDDHPDDA